MTAITLNMFDQPDTTPQTENLERVGAAIRGYVVGFCQELWSEGRSEFHLSDLTTYVQERAVIAPDSASRILRDCRRRGLVDYRIVSRRASLYGLTRVGGN